MKLSDPLKSAFGVYVTVLSTLITTVPCVPFVFPVTAGVASKKSVASTAIVLGVSSFVVALSSAMSTIAAMIILTVAVSVTPPDVTV